MKRAILAAVTAFAAALLPASAQAELPEGARAPDFSTQGAMAGRPFTFRLRQALRRGPVVLYFFPKAFTPGCTLESRAFADASDEFRALGATVVGLSNDPLPLLLRFSTEVCRSKFGVATASPVVLRAYDVELKRDGAATGLASRTSYVIAPDGRIRMVHSDMDYRDHVRRTLEAVRALRFAR